MKLSMQSLAKKLSLPSPKRGKKDGSKRGISRSEAPSFASTASSSSTSSDEGALARSAAPSPRSVIRPAEISRRELEAVLRRLGHGELSDDDLDAVAAIAAAEDAAAAGGDLDELMEAFRVFDADGDGRIDAEELRGVMVAILGGAECCSLDDCRRMIGGVDADGDGFVGFQDFARMMMATTAGTSTATDGARFL